MKFVLYSEYFIEYINLKWFMRVRKHLKLTSSQYRNVLCTRSSCHCSICTITIEILILNEHDNIQ